MKKINILTSWNALDGVAIHGELIAEGFLELGYKVNVFIPTNYEDKQPIFCEKRSINKKLKIFPAFSFIRYGDQYSSDEKILQYLYLEENILKNNPDFLIVEKPSSISLETLETLETLIKKKSPTYPKLIAIFHEGILPKRKIFYTFPWDKIVVFDERFENLFSPYFKTKKIDIVPFPYYNLENKVIFEKNQSDKIFEKIKILIISSIKNIKDQKLKKIKELMDIIKKGEKIIKKKIELTFLTAKIEETIFFESLEQNFSSIKFVFNRHHYTSDNFISLMNNYDLFLFLKEPSKKRLVISSMLNTIACFLKPIIAPDNEFFWGLDKEIFKYGKISEIPNLLYEALNNKEKIQLMKKNITINSPINIAKKIIKF